MGKRRKSRAHALQRLQRYNVKTLERREYNGSDINHGALAAAVRRALLAGDANAAVAGAGEGIENERDDADDQGAPKSGAEAVDGELGLHEEGNEVEQSGIDDQREEPEGHEQERQGNEHEHGAQDGIEDAEQEGGDKEVESPLVMDAAMKDVNGDQHSQGVDKPALEETYQRFTIHDLDCSSI